MVSAPRRADGPRQQRSNRACVDHGAHEAFYVLEGELRIVCGDEELVAGPGSFAFLPRDVPHTFVVEGDRDARLLNVLSPGGSEAFFADAGAPAAGPGLPPRVAPNVPELIRVGALHEIEVVGPPLQPGR